MVIVEHVLEMLFSIFNEFVRYENIKMEFILSELQFS